MTTRGREASLRMKFGATRHRALFRTTRRLTFPPPRGNTRSVPTPITSHSTSRNTPMRLGRKLACARPRSQVTASPLHSVLVQTPCRNFSGCPSRLPTVGCHPKFGLRKSMNTIPQKKRRSHFSPTVLGMNWKKLQNYQETCGRLPQGSGGARHKRDCQGSRLTLRVTTLVRSMRWDSCISPAI